MALATEQGTVAALDLGGDRAAHELVVPALEQLLAWSGVALDRIGGVAVGESAELIRSVVLPVPVVPVPVVPVPVVNARLRRGRRCPRPRLRTRFPEK